MNEVVTILTSASGHSLVKSFRGEELTKQNFSIGNLFQIVEEQVSDLKSLSNVLQKLENGPTHTIIRGSLVDGHAGAVRRTKETFISTPRQWCTIDIYSLAWNVDINDQQAMLAHAIQQLPAEFQSVSFWYHFSSGMGIKSGINAHLWFWLDRPWTDNIVLLLQSMGCRCWQ
jgi:hypothetical protein